MLLSRILAVSLLVLSPVAFAEGGSGGGLDINLNNTSAQFQFSGALEENAEMHAGLLYNDVSNIFVDAGVLAKSGGDAEAAGPIVNVGAKGVFGAIHRKNATGLVDSASAIAVGGDFGYGIPSTVPMAIMFEYYVAPKIMTFADAERFNQFGIRLEFQPSPQARVYIGYREIGFGIKSYGSTVLDSGTFVGVKLAF